MNSIQDTKNVKPRATKFTTPPRSTSNTAEIICNLKVNEICQKIIDFGLNHLLFKELCYLHQTVYMRASRLQEYNEPKLSIIEGRSTSRSRRRDGRLIILEAELIKCREMIRKLKNDKELVGSSKMSNISKKTPCSRNSRRSW